MLKRIDPAQVALGMFIHQFEGSWFNHPFWRARFLLTDPGQVEKVHESALDAVIIDTERGLDVAGAPAPTPVWPVWNRATSPASWIISYSG